MTTWWELTIPAVSGVLVGIGGTALGTWLQGVNSKRLFAAQAAEAAAARVDQARQERLMRGFDQRRDAYAAFLRLANEYHRGLIQLNLDHTGINEVLTGGPAGTPRPPDMKKCLTQAEALRDLILLLGPDEVVGAMADVLHLMWWDVAEVEPHKLGWAIKGFMQIARVDLGIDVPPL